MIKMSSLLLRRDIGKERKLSRLDVHGMFRGERRMINALRRKQRGIISYPRPSFRARHGIGSSSLDTGPFGELRVLSLSKDFRRYDEVAASPW
jgi:hypothetical protein